MQRFGFVLAGLLTLTLQILGQTPHTNSRPGMPCDAPGKTETRHFLSIGRPLLSRRQRDTFARGQPGILQVTLIRYRHFEDTPRAFVSSVTIPILPAAFINGKQACNHHIFRYGEVLL